MDRKNRPGKGKLGNRFGNAGNSKAMSVFVRDRHGCDALAEPTAWLPKLTEEGLTPIFACAGGPKSKQDRRGRHESLNMAPEIPGKSPFLPPRSVCAGPPTPRFVLLRGPRENSELFSVQPPDLIEE